MFSAEQLLLPISTDQPAGSDLTFSTELDAIAHARKFDDPSLDQGEWVTTLKEADWEFVVRRCAALLETTSKDLRLAVWMTEAAAKEYGMRGLGEGFKVLAGLVDGFWDQGLYPEAEDGDQEQRIGNLAWILARVPGLLREMPITDGNGGRWSQVDFDAARRDQSDGGKRLAEMEASRRATSSAFRETFAGDAAACLEALLAFERAADTRLGNDAPAFVAARDAVRDMIDTVPAPQVTLAPSADAASDAAGTAAGFVAGTAGTAAAPTFVASPGAIATRQQAIAQLREIADFFRRTEPHSPVSYFAEKAAKAGEQNLYTWLRTVVKDSATLAHLEEMLGVQPGDE